MASLSTSIEDLRILIQTHPVIDNHAHNLLCQEEALAYDKHPFEHIVSEAGSRAVGNAPKSLPVHRAVAQLSELFNCDRSWEAVKTARTQLVQEDYLGLVKQCLTGTEAILLDDMISDEGVEPYTWHDQFTTSKSKRLVRIEVAGAKILARRFASYPNARLDLIKSGDLKSQSMELDNFEQTFRGELQQALEDDEVVGFKSVICYRTGLNINASMDDMPDLAAASLARIITRGGDYRLEDKEFNDWLLITALQHLTQAKKNSGISKAIQFHSGFGDSDINLVHSNPAYMQPLIEKFPEIDFVLLHSSYPYTREAGYLATVYHNVYLDLSVVFPMVSLNAQESILRASLDITPTNRLLWGTDGHDHPEGFWLANKQFRTMLEKVLVDLVNEDQIPLPDALDAAADILYNNSNELYSLNLPRIHKSSDFTSSQIHLSKGNASFPPALNIQTKIDSDTSVWLQMVDNTATTRLRIVPGSEFQKLVSKQRRLGMSKGLLSMLQNDSIADKDGASGQFYLDPDMSSLRPNIGLSSNSVSVMTFWQAENGEDIEGCPRTTLRNVVEKFESQLAVDIKVGFEIEVVFMKPVTNDFDGIDYIPITTNHAWSAVTPETNLVIPMLEKIVKSLKSVGVAIEQYHAESSPGQFEFVLPPAKPLASCDMLLQARQVITNIVQQHGYRATLHPRPFPTSAGTASHAHFSISPPTHEEAVLAGVMRHLPSILAFAMPQEVSYARVGRGLWAGGEWVTWGTHNREAPVRKVSAGHWELKSLDGLANIYLAMSALLGAAYLGAKESLALTHKDCNTDASILTVDEHSQLGITTPLPKSLETSLAALESDSLLKGLLGPVFVDRYCRTKRAEIKYIREMPDHTRRNWLIEHY